MKKGLIAAPLIAVLFLLSAMATPVLADGGFFVMAPYLDVYQSAQRAVILYGNSTQHLILSIRFEGDAEEFAWVIPVPEKPEINVSDSELFWELSDLTIRAIPTPGFGCAFGGFAPSPDGVDVIQEQVVGPYATAILSAGDPTALVDWLNANGYFFPEDGQEIISEYIEKEWYFVATRINSVAEDTGDALAEGSIEPIVLSFASDEIVYPLRITSLSATSPEVLLYVFADQIVVPKQYPFRIGFGYWKENSFSLEFGETVSVEDLSRYDILPELVSTYLTGDEFYLTKLRGSISADQMVDIDLVGYEEGDHLYSLGYGSSSGHAIAGTNLNNGDIVLLTIITVPVFGLYLWRRHRRKVSGAN